MATVDQIKMMVRTFYPSSMRHGSLDISPPVNLVHIATKKFCQAYLLDPKSEKVALLGHKDLYPVSEFDISDKQGRFKPTEITIGMLDELEVFLNQVANERESEEGGFMPTYNARLARDFLDKFGMERRKPTHLR